MDPRYMLTVSVIFSLIVIAGISGGIHPETQEALLPYDSTHTWGCYPTIQLIQF